MKKREEMVKRKKEVGEKQVRRRRGRKRGKAGLGSCLKVVVEPGTG